MKFRVSGTPIAAALLRLIELDSKRGRVSFWQCLFRFVRTGHAQSLFSVNIQAVPSRARRLAPGLQSEARALLHRNIRDGRKIESLDAPGMSSRLL